MVRRCYSMLVPTSIKTVIPATFIKINSFLHDDAETTRIVSGIRVVGNEGVGEVYKVDRSDVATLIAKTDALGKDDSISVVIYPSGTMKIDVSEADAGGAGTTCAGRVYTYFQVLPPSVTHATTTTTPATETIDQTVRNVFKQFLAGLITLCTNISKLLP